MQQFWKYCGGFEITYQSIIKVVQGMKIQLLLVLNEINKGIQIDIVDLMDLLIIGENQMVEGIAIMEE